MRLLMNIPFKQKLNWIVMLTSSAAMLLAYASFATYEFIAYRNSMPVDLAVLATIIGENGKSALEFNDVRFAEKTLLASLAVQPHIMAACLYGEDGEVFAKYGAIYGSPYEVRRDTKHFLELKWRPKLGTRLEGFVRAFGDSYGYRSQSTSSGLG